MKNNRTKLDPDEKLWGKIIKELSNNPESILFKDILTIATEVGDINYPKFKMLPGKWLLTSFLYLSAEKNKNKFLIKNTPGPISVLLGAPEKNEIKIDRSALMNYLENLVTRMLLKDKDKAYLILSDEVKKKLQRNLVKPTGDTYKKCKTILKYIAEGSTQYKALEMTAISFNEDENNLKSKFYNFCRTRHIDYRDRTSIKKWLQSN